MGFEHPIPHSPQRLLSEFQARPSPHFQPPHAPPHAPVPSSPQPLKKDSRLWGQENLGPIHQKKRFRFEGGPPAPSHISTLQAGAPRPTLHLKKALPALGQPRGPSAISPSSLSRRNARKRQKCRLLGSEPECQPNIQQEQSISCPFPPELCWGGGEDGCGAR